jgi:hypothetical protein
MPCEQEGRDMALVFSPLMLLPVVEERGGARNTTAI